MKFSKKSAISGKMILWNDHYAAIPYDCTGLESLATDHVIPAGTIIPSNDAHAIGVLLTDVDLTENPNGTVVVHGFVKQSKLPIAPTAAAVTALLSHGVSVMDADGKPQLQKYTVTYDANGGTGTVTDSSSPYSYGSTVTVSAGTGLTAPADSSNSFKGWALSADAAEKNDAYDPSDTFTITDHVVLYAVWGK